MHLRYALEVACDRMAANLDFLATNELESRRIDDKYMRIRHEDFSMAPQQVAAEIYKFIGTEMTSEVENWLTKNTASGIASEKLSAQSTMRDSKAVASAWRKKLSFDHNKLIQDYCGNVLERLNYSRFESLQELRNMNTSSF